MSGFHRWMFKPRCLVFPFHWLQGQAGLCLAPSLLPSRYPEKGGVVPRAAYLRSRYGISCPFFWPCCHCPLTAHSQTPPFFLNDVYPQGLVENTARILGDRRISLHPLTCFVFQVEFCWTYPKLFLHYFMGSLSLHLICPQFLIKKKTASGKTLMCFFFWRVGDKISTLHINCCLEPLV